jgi:hypothetical protein
MSNLDLWNKLGKTDPEHTKSFTRGGGFKGTAVKPIYTDHKMTEQFGPCGVGWGITEPRYEVVQASEGQVAVYCWLSVWYVQDGKRSEPVPGIGGDMVVIKQSSGLRTNDEAFKAAATDAISNAMKHIGMSADVHMGRFDDHKYVQEMKDEAKAAAAPAKQPKAAVPTNTPLPAGLEPKPTADGAKFVADALIIALKKAQTPDALKTWWGDKQTQSNLLGLPAGDLERVKEAKAVRWAELTDGAPA